MEREPTREEIEAQLRQSEQDMADLANILESEASVFGLLAQGQAEELKARAQENLPLLAGSAAAVGLLTTLFLRGRRSDRPDALDGVPVRELDDEYVDLLARVVGRRLRAGEETTLTEALGQTLREQAPVVFQRPSFADESSSFLGTLLKLGLVAGVGLGLNYAVEQLTGQSLVDLVRGQVGGSSASSDYTVDRKYQQTHGTTGATIPDPTKPPAASTATGTPPTAKGAPRPTETATPKPSPSPAASAQEAAPKPPPSPSTTKQKGPETTASTTSSPQETTSEQKPSGGASTAGPTASASKSSAKAAPEAEPSTSSSKPEQSTKPDGPKGDLPGEAPASKKKENE